MKAIAAILLVLCHLAVSHGNGAQMQIRPNIGTVTPGLTRGRPTWPAARPAARPAVRPIVQQTGWNCDEGPRLYNARQLDAGQGKVVALDRNNYPYFLIGSSWQRLSSVRFRHLSVGPAGLWGSSTSNIVYKYVAGNFVQSRGTSMKQVDAGGDDQLVGVTTSNQAYCLRCSSALTYSGVGSLGWNYLSRRLKYYTCSPKNGCWGVDTSNRVYFTRTLNSVNCGASGWTQVAGQRMSMVEVGTDGRVFGLTPGGDVYQR
uniref:fish-egg lectin-like n=1 Tax=Epinephelus lanceolatus TaxID=310571 RepID=UPI0014464FC0|nr:fish-egg lectin-like [Epinephelus lanceolatus]